MNGCGPDGRGSPGCSAEQAFCGGLKPSALIGRPYASWEALIGIGLGPLSDEVNGPPEAETGNKAEVTPSCSWANASVTDDGQQTLAEDGGCRGNPLAGESTGRVR
jgi:hypothetical protein